MDECKVSSRERRSLTRFKVSLLKRPRWPWSPASSFRLDLDVLPPEGAFPSRPNQTSEGSLRTTAMLSLLRKPALSSTHCSGQQFSLKPFQFSSQAWPFQEVRPLWRQSTASPLGIQKSPDSNPSPSRPSCVTLGAR